ncbi:MAG: hypothetical protein GX339_09015 [Tissierellia bacterium]|nr:hypothetical protein [Tissierellia bacterium]
MEYLDIFESFNALSTYLDKYGGHKLAAGLTITEENINIFADELDRYIGLNTDQTDQYKTIKVDAILKVPDVSIKLYDEMNKFEPFGAGNQKPMLAIRDATLINIRKVGKDGNHISFKLSQGRHIVSAIGFGKTSILEKVLSMPFSYIVTLNENIFNQKRSIQLVLHDVEERKNFDYEVNQEKMKVLEFTINRAKSKIMKTDIFVLVEKLNKLYNTKITAEEIICMLKVTDNIQYTLKDTILYIKK